MATSDSIIQIENGVVKIIRQETERTVALSEFVRGLERRVPVELPLIARSQVFTYWDETDANHKKMYILAEIAPNVRTIHKRGRTLKNYRLALPWTYMWFIAETSGDIHGNNWSITNGQVFFSKVRYTRPDEKILMPAFLPNLYANGGVCWGSTGASHNQSLADQIDERVNGWYLSDFNSDLDHHVRYPYGGTNFKRWVEESKDDPACWMKWPEWEDTSLEKWSVQELFNANQGGIELIPRFNSRIAIPEVVLPYTFGRWEDFWRSIPAEHRGRAIIAAQNLIGDVGEAVFAPTPAANDMFVDEDDDGGVAV